MMRIIVLCAFLCATGIVQSQGGICELPSHCPNVLPCADGQTCVPPTAIEPARFRCYQPLGGCGAVGGACPTTWFPSEEELAHHFGTVVSNVACSANWPAVLRDWRVESCYGGVPALLNRIHGTYAWPNGSLFCSGRYDLTPIGNCAAQPQSYCINEWYQSIPLECPAGFTPRADGVCILTGTTHRKLVCEETNPYVGHPGSPLTGNKSLTHYDYAGTGSLPLVFSRHYNSVTSNRQGSLGVGWRHSLESRVDRARWDGRDGAWVHRATAEQYYMREDLATPGLFRSDSDISTFALVSEIDGVEYFDLHLADGQVERYGRNGRLREIRRQGQSLILAYDPTTGLLSQVEDTVGRRLIFTYDVNRMLQSLELPDGRLLAYQYDASTPESPALEYVYLDGQEIYSYVYDREARPDFSLLEAVSEGGAEYSTYSYYADGRLAIASLSGGLSGYSFVYGANETEVTGPLGEVQAFRWEMFEGSPRLLEVVSDDGVCSSCAGLTRNLRYDANGRVSGKTDFRGIEVSQVLNARGLAEVVHEVSNSPCPSAFPNCELSSRVTLQSWHPYYPILTERTLIGHASAVPDHRVSAKITAMGQVEAYCSIDASMAGVSSYECGSSLDAPAGVRQISSVYCSSSHSALGVQSCPFAGLLIQLDGPRTDVSDITRYSYYLEGDEAGCEADGPCHRRGDLQKVTDALGHEIWHVRYDGAGRVVRIRDANGVLTDFAYHPRGWLTQRIVRFRPDGLPDAGDAITSIAHTVSGLVERMTSPDGDFVQYTYDDAQRLEGMSDALGNYIVFTLDAAGNRIEEETFDPSGTLRRRLAREYSALSRLVAERDAIIEPANTSGRLVAEHGYDGNGNRTHTIDGHGHRSDYEYDPLNRLKRTLDAMVPRGITEFDYDARDNLVSVTDPNGLVTEYIYDGLGDLRELRSPDTGTTTYLYDAAGNRTSQTDARGVVTQYTYDALNRLTAIQYPSDPSLDVSFVYDQAPPICSAAEGFGVGRLAEVHDGSGSTFFCHDHRGNVVRKRVDHPAGSPLETRFSYTLGDRLSALTYPSGKTVRFIYDAAGRMQGMTYSEDQSAVEGTLLEAVTHYPFGPLASVRFGNGRLLEKAYDANYAIGGLSSSAPDGLNLQFEVDVLGNIAAITPEPGQTQEAARRYEYDALSRLTEVRDANQVLIEAFGYDPTGNRTTKTWQGAQQSYVYAPGSHWLLDTGTDQRTYDAAGNMVQRTQGRTEFGYEHGAHNRYQRHLVNGAEFARYAYNGHGERTCAWVGETLTRFVYDTGGRLLGEYQASGKPIIEYVYLGDLPVAAFAAHGLVYIETDHLGTPRVVVDAATNATLWHWPLTGRAFGEHDPVTLAQAGSAPFVFGLRYPGQRAEGESGLNYNYFRDYDANIGRYIQSDPIGIEDSMQTYGYVGSNSLAFVDPLGLARVCVNVTRHSTEWFPGVGHYRFSHPGFECIDLPDPEPPVPTDCRIEGCSCYERCVNVETWGGAGRTPLREMTVVSVDAFGVGATGAAAKGAALTLSSGCATAVVTFATAYSLAARGRCYVVCRNNPGSY